MGTVTKELKLIAEKLIKLQHSQIARGQTDSDRVEFVNASKTIQTHSDYLQKMAM